jgi:hypothetical protein
MPLMVFFTLGIVQLAMVQQARLMTEYAAYQAARAGIVWNGSNERMHDAAVVALLPTLGKTDARTSLANRFLYHQGLDRLIQALPWGAARVQVNGQSLTGMIRVDTVNPTGSSAATVWNQLEGAGWEELDFDGPETYPETASLESHLRRFYDLKGEDPQQEEFRKATLLQIRLRYFYELRIPFVNQVIFLSWYAANADVALFGAIDRSSTNRENLLGRSGDVRALRRRAMGLWDPLNKGLYPLTSAEMRVLWDVATGALRVAPERKFFLPLFATQSMRMQSNFYKKWLVHP